MSNKLSESQFSCLVPHVNKTTTKKINGQMVRIKLLNGKINSYHNLVTNHVPSYLFCDRDKNWWNSITKESIAELNGKYYTQVVEHYIHLALDVV